MKTKSKSEIRGILLGAYDRDIPYTSPEVMEEICDPSGLYTADVEERTTRTYRGNVSIQETRDTFRFRSREALETFLAHIRENPAISMAGWCPPQPGEEHGASIDLRYEYRILGTETPGCIHTASMREMDPAGYDEVWLIVRSLKKKPDSMNTFHVPELSPSWGLFQEYLRLKKQGQWNEQSYMETYVPQFLKEMHTQEAKTKLNELWCKTAKQGRRIQIVCFCPDRQTCHRRLVEGLLAGAGAPAGIHEPWIWETYRNMPR